MNDDDNMVKLHYRINYGVQIMKRVMKGMPGIRRKDMVINIRRSRRQRSTGKDAHSIIMHEWMILKDHLRILFHYPWFPEKFHGQRQHQST